MNTVDEQKPGSLALVDFEDAALRYSINGPGRTSEKPLNSLSEVLETLYSEHRYISSLLDALESEAEKLKPRKIPDFQLLLDIVDYLKYYPGKYHHPREDLLFSMLLKKKPGFQKQLGLLERDHQKLEQLNELLFVQLKNIAHGDKVHRPSLLKEIEVYVTHYREHIYFESKNIFPLAKGELGGADLKKLHSKTRYINDPLFGGKLAYNYHRLSRNFTYEFEYESGRLAMAEFRFIESFVDRLSRFVSTSQQLGSAIGQHQRNAFDEQLKTCRESVGAGFSTKLLSLPLKLAGNHARQARDGWRDISAILKGKKCQSDSSQAASISSSRQQKPVRH